MATVGERAPGSVCWVELRTHHPEEAKEFYAALFGWDFDDTVFGSDEAYSVGHKNGRDAAALCRLPARVLEQGVTPYWLCYFSVPSADEAVARANALGGTSVVAPFDAPDHGRMALVRDPSGATFAVWQAIRHHGIGVVDEPGSLCWSEIMTHDVDQAATFYTGLFSWKTRKWPGPVDYTIFRRGQASVAGMIALSGPLQAMPSQWMVHFAVADCDASAAATLRLGGSVLIAPSDLVNVGRYALLRDPHGVPFCVLHSTA